ncbi:MAG: hypothetical protein AAF630_07375 [Cyanobacteria bacterium P01_C01_bin.38]
MLPLILTKPALPITNYQLPTTNYQTNFVLPNTFTLTHSSCK